MSAVNVLVLLIVAVRRFTVLRILRSAVLRILRSAVLGILRNTILRILRSTVLGSAILRSTVLRVRLTVGIDGIAGVNELVQFALHQAEVNETETDKTENKIKD